MRVSELYRKSRFYCCSSSRKRRIWQYQKSSIVLRFLNRGVESRCQARNSKILPRGLRSFHVQSGLSTTALNVPLIIKGEERIYGEGVKAVRRPLTADILLRMVSQINNDENGSMSRQPSVWHLPPSYDLETLRRMLVSRIPSLQSLSRSYVIFEA